MNPLLYLWQGPEKSLSGLYSARRLTIETFEDEAGTLKATGEIETYDHVEGCNGSHKWETSGLMASPISWKVSPRDAFWQTADGQGCFTLSSDADIGIAAFVIERLIAFGKKHESTPPESFPITEGPVRYEGPMTAYAGPCVCKQAQTSNASAPFPWAELTGGQFPERCFQCSCGRRWWCCDVESAQWAPVGDPAAWTMFTEYNGEAVEFIGQHPERPEIWTLPAIREEGFIPLG